MNINLIDGKITHKSKFNFPEFSEALDTRVKYSLVLHLLNSVGLSVRTEDSSLIMELSDIDKANNFYLWIEERQKYLQSKNIGIVENV